MCVCVVVYMRVMCMEVRDHVGCPSSWVIHLVLRQCRSLAWSSLSRVVWIASKSRDLPVSVPHCDYKYVPQCLLSLGIEFRASRLSGEYFID